MYGVVLVLVTFRCEGVRYIMTHSSRNVDKAKLSAHLCRHAFQKACELFADVLFEGRASPASHFLYFLVGVACERESVRATTAEGMCIDSINWNTLFCGVVKCDPSELDGGADVLIRYIILDHVV